MAKYDLNLLYHPGQVNVVLDALSRRPTTIILTEQKGLIEEMRRLTLEVVLPGEVAHCMALQLQSSLVNRIKEAQAGDKQLQKFRNQVEAGLRTDLMIHEDISLTYGTRLWVPKGDVKQELPAEAHNSSYNIHPGRTKMYRDMRQQFWWHGTKREIARFVSKCLVCQQVKAEHQRKASLLQPLPIPEWKWKHITVNFVTALLRSPKGHNAIWVIMDRLTKSAHFIPFRVGQSIETLAECYMQEIVRIHGY